MSKEKYKRFLEETRREAETLIARIEDEKADIEKSKSDDIRLETGMSLDRDFVHITLFL